MNELDRLLELSELDLDYTESDAALDDLTHLAARICNAKVSLVNLVDEYNQWSVSRYGTNMRQIKREDSVCQYTIQKDNAHELRDLEHDPRFKDKEYVCAGPELNYYYGIPLKTRKGANIGALCVLNDSNLHLGKEQTVLLGNLAQLVVCRLESIQHIRKLQGQINEAIKSKTDIGHDIRGPISGILGVVGILKEDLREGKLADFDELLSLIGDSGESVLELADSILCENSYTQGVYTCRILMEKLEQLYLPQAKAKNVKFLASYHDPNESTQFPSKVLLQIVGNLIDNALKFTPEYGSIDLRISVKDDEVNSSQSLLVEVEDNGVGMSEEKIDKIRQGRAESDVGIRGERGFGHGLPLVKQLVDKNKGSLGLFSRPGKGCKFTVCLPI